MTDLAQLLVKAKVFAELWNDQDGCGAYVLDELAATINGYLRENPFLAQAAAAKAAADARRNAFGENNAFRLRDATDAEQRAALVEWDRSQPGGSAPRPPAPFVAFGKADLVELPDFHLQRVHVELLVQQVLHQRGLHGVLLMRNDSTVALEVVKRDGTSVGFPPSAVGEMVPGDIVRTPPRVLDELTQGVTEREVLAAQRARRSPADFLWITRLPDGRALFLLPWMGTGAQLSIGALGADTFTNTWDYHYGHTDDAWRAVLGWDGIGEPKGWTRHPASGRVRLDGTPASEEIER